MKVRGLIVTDVEVDEIECLQEILKKLYGKGKYDNDIYIEDNKIIQAIDVSCHGRPEYEYKTITDDPMKVELFKHLERSITILKDLESKKMP